jgi:isopenicillin N synthase-like dioxygenase
LGEKAALLFSSSSKSANRPTSYKVAGATYADADGSTDLAEFINVSKDDAFAYPKVVHKVYPPTVNVRMKDAVKPFIQSCADASSTLIDVFNQKLGLPEGTLAALHRTEMECISESRCIKVPPPPKNTKIALGQHTDFGRYCP